MKKETLDVEPRESLKQKVLEILLRDDGKTLLNCWLADDEKSEFCKELDNLFEPPEDAKERFEETISRFLEPMFRRDFGAQYSAEDVKFAFEFGKSCADLYCNLAHKLPLSSGKTWAEARDEMIYATIKEYGTLIAAKEFIRDFLPYDYNDLYDDVVCV